MKKFQSVRLGFQRDCIDIPLDLLCASKSLGEGIKQTTKYLQIHASVKAVGLVESVVVAPSTDKPGAFIVLDGHMRVEALRDLGHSSVSCLLSTDDEGYTYNKQVNRLSAIQQHRMIIKAVEDGTPIAKLANALHISENAIRDRFKLLDGICNEAIALLADKPATLGMFRILRQMKAFRQIDVAQAMINLNSYSIRLALAMLHATSPEQLIEKAASKIKQDGLSETLQRVERELAAVQAETKLLEESYGPANLQLMIIKTHIKALLENASIVKWLAKFHREYLQQLQLIAEIKQLPAE
ncbi:MAG: ParB-like nuclease [Polaromonas sp.]|jgi:ParB-like chromosome segregation protein Spo0J|nr:ParB-like nuclease [Polaromonas sp.]